MNLDNFFKAKSVAIVGVTREPKRVGHDILRNFNDGDTFTLEDLIDTPEEARSVSEDIQENPENFYHTYYSDLTIILGRHRRVDLAENVLSFARKRNELDSHGYSMLAMILDDKQDTDAAIKINKIIRLI